MLKVHYSAPSEVRVNDRLEKLEKYTHKLSDITDYLLTAKYAKAKDHAKEVAEFFATLDEAATAIFRVIHERHAATSVKPSAELKPKELSHDTSMATFRMWKKQFRAYYDAGIRKLILTIASTRHWLLGPTVNPRGPLRYTPPSRDS